jgi:hypothetical protein
MNSKWKENIKLFEKITFIQEWIVPKYTKALEEGEGEGHRMEVFHLAYPEEPVPPPRPEYPELPTPRWIPLTEVSNLFILPDQVKVVCRQLSEGQLIEGEASIFGKIGH